MRPRTEYFDMSAEETVALMMGEPLTRAEWARLYAENLQDGRVPSNVKHKRDRSQRDADSIDIEVAYAYDGE